MSKKFSFFLIILVPLLVLISFIMRLNFWPFVNSLGMYQGDLWYFQTNYGKSIQQYFFFPIEYPTGYVILLKLTSQLSRLFGDFDYTNFVYANMLMMLPLSAGTSLLIYKLAKLIGAGVKRSFLYILISPTFFIASTTNLDLYPVFLTLLSIYLLFKNKIFFSFLFLGIGAAIKLYPGFLVPLFFLYMLNERSSARRIIKGLAGFALSFGAINLPYILYNFNFWLFPYHWQTTNPQLKDPNTISYLLNYIHLGQFRTVFFGLIILISIVASLIIYQRKKLTKQNFIFLTYLTVFSAVFGNHVLTPQYILWFLPFTALTATPQIIVWWLGDAVNSAILWFYFKLSNDYPGLKLKIFSFLIIYFSYLYLNLLYTIRKIANHEKIES